jgi:hypothetical protein
MYSLALWLSLSLGAASASEPAFRMDAGRLTVRSAGLEMTLEGGAVVSVKDRRSGEVFSDSEPWQLLPQIPSGSVSKDDLHAFCQRWREKPDAYVQDKQLQQSRRRPAKAQAVQFQQRNATEAELAYRLDAGGQAADELRLCVRIDGAAGEIVLDFIARHADPQRPPAVVDVPVLALRTPGVILGNGARYGRSDPAEVDFCIRWANNLYSPRMAVVEGKQGCLAVWADRPHDGGNLILAHSAATDHLVLRAERDPREPEPARLASTTWRFGSFPTWADAARRYRQLFEAATGARPLWDNACPWVRGIHAVVTQLPAPAEADSFYARLAETVAPERVLLFYWNGDRIVLFGDHRYMTKLGRPQPEVVAALKKRGFRWLGYHPYVLLFSPQATQERLQELERKGELPPGYVFTPDYDGPPDKFHAHFREVATGYYRSLDTAQLWVLHPGSPAARQYLLRNFANYCRHHGMDGAYLDIFGGDADYQFPPEKKVFDGLNFRAGEARWLSEIVAQHPELAVMSEIQSEWTVPRTFYTWEGSTHFHLPRTYASIRTKVNHPLRTALWGSYTWTREEELDADEAALIGALPTLVMGDDWSTARARFFTEQALFHDCPSRWDAGVLACYRGSDGRRFEYRTLPCGDGFVERSGAQQKLRLGRFLGQQASPLAEPARIQDWPAYREGKPIGLNPDRVYPFLLESPQPDEAAWITSLPPGVFLRAVDRSPAGMTVHLGRRPAAAPSQPLAADSAASEGPPVPIGVQFHRRCLRVADAWRDHPGPFAAGTQHTFQVPVPGGLVFVWDESPAVAGRSAAEFVRQTGRTLAHGVADRFWCYNSHTRAAPATLAGREQPAVHVGVGRYRGYAASWVAAPTGKPVLKFDVGYSPPADKNRPPRRPLRLAVSVNGLEVWAEEFTARAEWQSREVPLTRVAGRTVLLTVAAEVTGRRAIAPAPDDAPAMFGGMRIDNP